MASEVRRTIVKTNIAAVGAVVAVAGLLGAGLSGCSFDAKVGGGTPFVSAEDLQKDLTRQLDERGIKPQSVKCKDKLPGEVGKTARCDVSFSETNSLEAVFTTTKVEGTEVSFDITPAMTKEQVEKAAANIASAQSATCEAGLDGKVGSSTKCEVTIDGKASKRVVEVSQVDLSTLGMELSVIVLLPRQQVSELLLQKLGSDGRPIETVECVDDVAAKVGSTVECVAVTGDEKQGYDVTVTEAQGDTVNFDYQSKP